MPTILRIHGFRFFFYMNEHLPIHIHVVKGGAEAKIVIEPTLFVESVRGFKAKELKQILEIVAEHQAFIINKWNDTFRKS